MAAGRHTKVLKLDILKPVGGLSWKDLSKTLRDVRYRTFRLANLAVSEAYLAFHLWRTGRADEFKRDTIGKLNKRLRDLLIAEGVPEAEIERFSRTGALPATVCDALAKYKIGAITAPSKWREIVVGKASLPTFRATMAIPIRCDKRDQKRLERPAEGDVELDLMLCQRPYPRVVVKTGNLSGGAKAILDRLLDNSTQDVNGYRQRCFEVKQDERRQQWVLFVTYDFPAVLPSGLNEETIVGVDLGVSCPMYVSLNNGYARLGRRQFAALSARVRSLQRQTMARRRSMLTGGKSALSKDTARSGHGRRRKLQSIEQLEGRIHAAYTTLNHQLSRAVIDFARNHGAAAVQLEDLTGLKDQLAGTFLGATWRYHQLQQFIKYKAEEAGIKVRFVNPYFTSRRCSQCGHIHAEFDRSFRDANRQDGYVARFVCPACSYEEDPDYNAARNLATLDIADHVQRQCTAQGLEYRSLTSQN